MLLPAMPRHKTAADELASKNLDGADARRTGSPAPLRRLRRAAAIGQAVAADRCERQGVWVRKLSLRGRWIRSSLGAIERGRIYWETENPHCFCSISICFVIRVAFCA